MRRLSACGLLLIGMTAVADDPTAAPRFDFASSAAKYEVEVRGSGKKCEPYQVDLLKWTNPIRGTLAGSVFIWTRDGMPQAACCMYAYRDKGGYAVDHELVSLTTEKLDASYAGESVWKAEDAGIAWSPIPKAPAPAATRPARLVQMRNLAKTFIGYIGTPAKRRTDLRLLPQPIYRHPEKAEMDGGVFAFVQATDPEVLLLMRINKKAESPVWEFAAARMTIVHAFLTVEDRVVWSVAWWEKMNDTTYVTRSRVPFMVEER
jgi:hypothetical protein